MSYRPRHLCRRDDRRVGGWVIVVGLFLLAPALGAALAGPYLYAAP
jgi:hypothetical protein